MLVGPEAVKSHGGLQAGSGGNRLLVKPELLDIRTGSRWVGTWVYLAQVAQHTVERLVHRPRL